MPERPTLGDPVENPGIAPDPYTQISMSQALELARKAGIPEDQLPIAVAIAMAESNLSRTAFNGKAPDQSYGLWQINMIGNMGPARRQALGIDTNQSLFNPEINAKAMALIYNDRKRRGGTGWEDWTTFTSGKYKDYLTTVVQQINGDPGEAIAEDIPIISGAIRSWSDLFGLFSDRTFWTRLGIGALGVLLVILLLTRVIFNTKSKVAANVISQATS